MTIHVLLVDDSSVIRKLLSQALQQNPHIVVVGTASNGQEAVAIAQWLQPHIIILDIEMPIMDGITALPLLLEAAPNARVIMASRLTHASAKISMEALERGASDYIPKPEIDHLDAFYAELTAKVLALAPRIDAHGGLSPDPLLAQQFQATPPVAIQAVALAASTGGPQALIQLFTGLQGQLSHLPCFINQAMPASFTPIFVEHLAAASKLPCVEAVEGDTVVAGTIYLAPGDRHMRVVREGGACIIRTSTDEMPSKCVPSADPMFQSLSETYGASLLGIVLTGMGEDGVLGAEMLVKKGGLLMAQDAQSSIVYGMPKAVAERRLCHAILPLDKLAPAILKRCGIRSKLPL